MNATHNQRKAPRVPIGYQIKVVTEDEMVAYSSALNISTAGLLLTPLPGLSVGARCGVVIFLLDRELGKRVVAKGTVVRSDELGTAIQFQHGLNSESLEALETLVASLHPQVGGPDLNPLDEDA